MKGLFTNTAIIRPQPMRAKCVCCGRVAAEMAGQLKGVDVYRCAACHSWFDAAGKDLPQSVGNIQENGNKPKPDPVSSFQVQAADEDLLDTACDRLISQMRHKERYMR